MGFKKKCYKFKNDDFKGQKNRESWILCTFCVVVAWVKLI